MIKHCLNTYYISILYLVLSTTMYGSVLLNSVSTYNDTSITTTLIPPSCTTLIQPLNGDTNVPVETNFTWNFIPDATGYKLTLGTTPGATDILNNFDVGNSTFYNLPVNLPGSSNIYVKITPYNSDGDATTCIEENFITGATAPGLTCTTLVQPLNNAVNVSVATDLTWLKVQNATGYKLSIGTTVSGAELLNNFNVGNTTTYNLSGNYPANTSIYVTIIPYDASGDNSTCLQEHFITGGSGLAPDCTTLSIPMDGDTDVLFNTNLTWLTVPEATGYRLSLGTTAGGTDILNAFDVGNTNFYEPTSDFPGNTRIFVTITPYNNQGNATGCITERFTTGTVFPVPNCTKLILPLAGAFEVPVDTDLEWLPVADATGYILTVETFTDNIDIFNRFDVGDITRYNIPGDLPENRRIYVIIEPYNLAGEAIGCTEEIFTTGKAGIHAPPKFFTPNNDGVHDYWITPNPVNRIAQVHIYNRYGKLLKTIIEIEKGWDGTSNGNILPTDDYWYQIVYTDGSTLQGHMSLKR
ncbi:T9SS type B sorting domain-containing protein [Algibacter amylolyticus]|uniref:T9SS type B sorting domain-containing protein n=1 Tax=Algibacter amylolyticus TaxID=1608400 RepID=A0A5M7BKZ3_9FLAO|nr:T9SS type B sorting domain-containing protein [Algibacter amylolyticus]KAA5827911.1 T9SS type B sorting domain-containing protein [Algibacter amylolyticus]MBB5267144.1 gliding motility-associated-like protein [Algibacter amylolyticus]TSJ82156.1 T9SS type B sorting domain-containing protein [Algibacter amylolyticus]